MNQPKRSNDGKNVEKKDSAKNTNETRITTTILQPKRKHTLRQGGYGLLSSKSPVHRVKSLCESQLATAGDGRAGNPKCERASEMAKTEIRGGGCLPDYLSYSSLSLFPTLPLPNLIIERTS